MKPNLHLSTSQNMAMTPQLLQSIRLLQLSTLELEQELRQALERNVLLEPVEDEAEEEIQATEARAEHEAADAGVTGQDADAHSKVEADFDWSSRESWSGGEPRDEDGESWEARTVAPRSADARIQAIEQLELVIETPREARLVSALLEAIDDNGYLEQPLDGIAMECGLQPLPDQQELEAALAKVQSVEPSGFGARDLRECLMLQLRALPQDLPGRDLAMRVVDEALDQLGEHAFAGLAEQFGVDLMDLHDAIELVLSLNPKPGATEAGVAEAAIPDVIVSGTPGAWKVELNAERLPRVRVNRLYENLLQGAGGHRALKDQLQEARWLVRGIEMRHETMLRTARAIFERQAEFLDRGEEGMAPLTLREIADTIGMHESTVCRVTTNKWVQTPWGVYELKAFFPSQIVGAERETSGTAVKAMIRRIINTESTNSPLCDGDIAAILYRNGVRVARRTVAKYREAMKIPPAKERVPGTRTRHLRLVG